MLSSQHTLILGNYKTPLLSIKAGDGFGYYGAIQFTEDGSKMQCHICGGLFAAVGLHSHFSHNLSAAEYREKFMLSKRTALVSEEYREKRKNIALMALAALSDTELERRNSALAVNRNKNRRGIRLTPSLEKLNQRGTCPEQTLDKLRLVANTVNRAPSEHDIRSVLGSWRYVVLARRYFGSIKEANKAAGLQRRVGRGIHYSDDELLEALRMHKKNTGKTPTCSDAKRGLIPSQLSYWRRFGSFSRARELAGV